MPKVTVIITTYNRANYISDTIDSVLNQTYKGFEILVVDDGSTDNTKDVLERYGNKIIYLYQNNKGPSAARNLGIGLAKGEYISFLDSDDIYLLDKLKAQVKFLEQNPSISLVYSWWDYIDSKGKILEYKGKRNCKNNITAEDILLGRACFNFSSFLYRKFCFINNLFDEGKDMKGVEDSDLWIRLAYQGFKFVCIPRILVEYRIHKDSLYSNNEAMFQNYVNLYKKIFDAYNINKDIKKRVYYNFYYEFSWRFYYCGNKEKFQDNLKKTIELRPNILDQIRTYYQWAYNHVPLRIRSDTEVFKKLSKISRNIFDFLDYLSSCNKLSHNNFRLESVAYSNAHVAMANLFYYARDMKNARLHFLAGFKLRPFLILKPVIFHTFIKSLLSKTVISIFSKFKKSCLHKQVEVYT